MYLALLGYTQDNNLYLVLGLLLVILFLGSLLYYIDQTNRDISGFLTSIKYNDFTATATAEHRGKSFGDLYQAFNLINRKFQEVRADKEANHQFLQTIVEQIEVGLLCYNADGEVKLMNKALQRLLRKPFLLHIDGLAQIDERLPAALQASRMGERDVVKIQVENKLQQLAFQTNELRLQDEQLYLVSIKDIQSELEEQELTAWQKLIRILTHEIMNSVAPITSLSGTIDAMLSDEIPPNEQSMKAIHRSVKVIQRRGEGLLDFTETYRSLTRIPNPTFRPTEANKLLQNVFELLQGQAKDKGVTLHLHELPSSLTFQADETLLEQVLINLVKNAIEACANQEDVAVHLHLQRQSDGQPVIQIADNGPGIPPEDLEQIFVPFFTTKPEGSGIGLSLSRQIMRMHKGSIEVQSAVGEGTVFSLSF